MKKSDIAMIILIAAVGVLVSFFVVRAILGNASSEPKKVPVVDEITSQITPPDSRIFNSNAINPSVEVEIEGETTQAQPSQDTTEAQE